MSLAPSQRKLVGFVGGSASGKTSLRRRVARHLHTAGRLAAEISKDMFYKDLRLTHERKVAMMASGELNFDRPDAFDTKLFLATIDRWLSGESVEEPGYDFMTSSRLQGRQVHSADVLLIDGLFLLNHHEILDRLDLVLAVRTPEPVRKERRLKRDVEEGRAPNREAAMPFLLNALAMHNTHIEPLLGRADLDIRNNKLLPAGQIELELQRLSALAFAHIMRELG